MAITPLLVASHGSSVVATGLKVSDSTGDANSASNTAPPGSSLLTMSNVEQKWTDVAYDRRTGKKHTDGTTVQDLYTAVPNQCPSAPNPQPPSIPYLEASEQALEYHWLWTPVFLHKVLTFSKLSSLLVSRSSTIPAS